jgi:drug/metabolite transporter superfamily protein YnfA
LQNNNIPFGTLGALYSREQDAGNYPADDLKTSLRGIAMTFFAWFVFIAAALLEVGGDAVVRRGLRGSSLIIIVMGFVMLGSYGVVVNTVKWDFSKLLGVYVAVFAVISILFGRFVFEENIPTSTWLGLVAIICGGLIIQFGDKILR